LTVVEMFQKSLAVQLCILGEDHPEKLKTMNGMVIAIVDLAANHLGDIEDTTLNLREVQELCSKTLMIAKAKKYYVLDSRFSSTLALVEGLLAMMSTSATVQDRLRTKLKKKKLAKVVEDGLP